MPEPLMTIEAFADYIEKLPYGNCAEVGFDMGNARPVKSHLPGNETTCGTACCIGGHARLLLGERGTGRAYDGTIATALSDLLGLHKLQAREVCYPYNRQVGHPQFDRDKMDAAHHATPKQAAFLLRHLATTGVVDWDLAMQQGAE